METTSRANDDMNRDLVPCLVVRIHLFLACLFGSKTFARFTQCHQHGTRHESAWSATSTAVHSQALKAPEVLSYTKSASSVVPRWSNVVLGVYGVRRACNDHERADMMAERMLGLMNMAKCMPQQTGKAVETF